MFASPPFRRTVSWYQATRRSYDAHDGYVKHPVKSASSTATTPLARTASAGAPRPVSDHADA